MPDRRASGLRRIADNLDLLADDAARRGRTSQVETLINNARYLRRTADIEHQQETKMGQFADRIHDLEKKLAAARVDADQGKQAQAQLDTLKAENRIADDADVAALTEPDTGTETTPTPPADVPTPPAV